MKTHSDVRTRLKATLALTLASLLVVSCDSSTDDGDNEEENVPVSPVTEVGGPDEQPETVQPVETPTPIVLSDPLYLNIDNITVVEGQNSTPSLNNTVSLDNVIDAPSADAIEVHTQQTHVWHTGERLELLFDLQGAYVLDSVHFWNYSGESYDVDNVDFIFTDELSEQVGAFSFSPELSESNNTESQTIEIDFDEPVRFVEATITGTNGQSDFQNIGFTARKVVE